jgi:hypothetical protein
MAADFVRYSPKIKTFDPNLEEYLTRIIDFWEKTISGSPSAVRGVLRRRLAWSGQKSRY